MRKDKKIYIYTLFLSLIVPLIMWVYWNIIIGPHKAGSIIVALFNLAFWPGGIIFNDKKYFSIIPSFSLLAIISNPVQYMFWIYCLSMVSFRKRWLKILAGVISFVLLVPGLAIAMQMIWW